jgi:hypothetical protein
MALDLFKALINGKLIYDPMFPIKSIHERWKKIPSLSLSALSSRIDRIAESGYRHAFRVNLAKEKQGTHVHEDH